MIPAVATSKRFLVVGALLLGLLLITWGVSSLTSSRYEAKMDEQRAIAAAAEARAEEHRKRAAEFEARMNALQTVVEAKNVLIEANTKQAAKINDAIDAEAERFETERGADDSLTADQLRDRICAKHAKSLPTYCGGKAN
jgi:hypothetical protein